MKHIYIALSALIFSLAAHAQTYMQVGYTSTNYSASALSSSGTAREVKASPAAARGILGYEVNPSFSIEGMLVLGLSDSNISVSGISTPVNLKVDHLYGFYGKPKFQASPDLEVFARIGYAHSKGTMTYQSTNTSMSGNSLSYGVGMSYAINKQMSVNIDAMTYYDKNSTRGTGTTVGIGYKF
jgi:opacity protein-like surface antigen